jgi:chemotaxis methyl-accepting protein methylase
MIYISKSDSVKILIDDSLDKGGYLVLGLDEVLSGSLNYGAVGNKSYKVYKKQE